MRLDSRGDCPERRSAAGECHPNGPVPHRTVRLLPAMGTILWILAVILVVFGIVSLVRGQVLAGIALIIVGLLVGPGGVSIFT